MREKRASLRSEGKPLKSTDLAEGLIRYSIQGQKYVQSIKRIIHQNRLTRLSQAKLRLPKPNPLPWKPSTPAFSIRLFGHSRSDPQLAEPIPVFPILGRCRKGVFGPPGGQRLKGLNQIIVRMG